MSDAQDARNFASGQAAARATAPGPEGLWNLGDLKSRSDYGVDLPVGARFRASPEEIFGAGLFATGASPLENMGLQEYLGKNNMSLPQFAEQTQALPLRFGSDNVVTYDPAFQKQIFSHTPSSYGRNQKIGVGLLAAIAGGGPLLEGLGAGGLSGTAALTGETIGGGSTMFDWIPQTFSKGMSVLSQIANPGSGGDSWFNINPMDFLGGGVDAGSVGYENSFDLGGMLPLLAGSSSAGGEGFGAILERLKSMPWKGIAGGFDVVKSLYGLSQANKLQQLAQQYGERADPYGPYRGQAAERLARLQADPSLLSETPGYQAGLQAVQRGLAGSGYLGSGNEKIALLKYGGDIYNQETGRLAQLAGAQFSPANAGQIGMTGAAGAANLRGNVLNNIARNIYNWGTS